MKKLNYLILIYIIVCSSAYSQSIKVKSPQAGDVWEMGKTYTIVWKSVGQMDPNVKINIFRDSIAQPNFVEQIVTSNTGSKSWIIPLNYTSGKYRIRIKTAGGNPVYGDSSVFEIRSSKTKGGNLILMAPKGGETLCLGKAAKIWWKSSGQVPGNVKVNIFRNSISKNNFIDQLTASNTGSVIWNIPPGYSSGLYLIRIKSAMDNSIFNDSLPFTITNCKQKIEKLAGNFSSGRKTVVNRFKMNSRIFMVQPFITVYEPKKGTVWNTKKQYYIKWKSTGVMASHVTIYAMYLKENTRYWVAYNVPNNGEFFYKDFNNIGWNPGSYRIRIETVDLKNYGRQKDLVIGESEIFTISN